MTKTNESTNASTTLMVRLDAESKSTIAKAAALRKMSVSDYVRQVLLPQAQRELELDRSNTICLTPDEQLAFWQALQQHVKLTPAQKKLGRRMRGES